MKQNKANPRYPKLSETSKLISTGIITFGLLFTANAQQDSMKTTQLDSASLAKLQKNYPNPFMPTTTIKFSLDSASVNDSAVVTLYDYNGLFLFKKVIHISEPVRKDRIFTFDINEALKGHESGVYLYSLNFKGKTMTNKYVHVK